MLTKTKTLGALIDDLAKLRDAKKELAAKAKELDDKQAALEEEIFGRLEAEGMDKASGKLASISVGYDTVPNIVDYDALCAYIKKKGHFHLLQRRISAPAYRELLELGKPVPGLEPFQKRKLNFSARS